MFFESNYILNIVVAMLKYTIMEQVSTNVVINGEAINAGSRPIFLANSGRVQPMIFERVTVTINDRAITIASPELWYSMNILSPLAVARTMPTIIDIWNS